MEITWLGVLLALLVTAGTTGAYLLGVTVGKDRGFIEGYERAKALSAFAIDQEFQEMVKPFFVTYEDEERWD